MKRFKKKERKKEREKERKKERNILKGVTGLQYQTVIYYCTLKKHYPKTPKKAGQG